MPDFSTIAGGPSDVSSVPASSTAVITPTNTANVKNTTWTELLAATTYQTEWLLVNINGPVASTTIRSFLLDIGVGASTAETALISNLYYYSTSTTNTNSVLFLFPLRIPKGTRISARHQCNNATGQLHVGLHAIASTLSATPGMGRVETCGADTTNSRGTVLNDPGAVIHTDGTWTEIIAATAFNYRWLCVAHANTQTATTTTECTHLLDIAVGAGGSEQAFVNDLFLHAGSGSVFGNGSTCFPCAIAGGSRIAARHRCRSGTAGDRRLELVLYGVA